MIIAVSSLAISIPLSKLYGGIGCAVGTALALIAGQIIVMNIYYHRVIHIDISQFWKEIGKMSLAPLMIGLLFYSLFNVLEINTVWMFIIGVLVFSSIYIPLFCFFGMTSYEKELFFSPMQRIANRFQRIL